MEREGGVCGNCAKPPARCASHSPDLVDDRSTLPRMPLTVMYSSVHNTLQRRFTNKGGRRRRGGVYIHIEGKRGEGKLVLGNDERP